MPLDEMTNNEVLELVALAQLYNLESLVASASVTLTVPQIFRFSFLFKFFGLRFQARLTIGNWMRMFEMADRFALKDFTKSCYKFADDNAGDFLKSEDRSCLKKYYSEIKR